VAFARIFFPSEAKLAMCIAEADSTEEFTGATLSKLKEVGLSEIPTMQNMRLRQRLVEDRYRVSSHRCLLPL
jgi:regulatory protein NPR1